MNGTKINKGLKRLVSFILILSITITQFPVSSYARDDGENEDGNNSEFSCSYEQNEGFIFTYNNLNSWNTHSNVEVRVDNETDYDKSLWKILLIYDGVIENVWNADIEECVNNGDGTFSYIISPKTYNNTITSQGFISFGFISYGLDDIPSAPIKLEFWDGNSISENIVEDNNKDNEERSSNTDAEVEVEPIEGRDYQIKDDWKGLTYALFTSSDEGEEFYVNTASIKGSIHTNGNFSFTGNSIAVSGILEAAGGITLNTSDAPDSQLLSSDFKEAAKISMPDIDVAIHDLIEEDREKSEFFDIYDDYKYYGADEISLEKNIYIKDGVSFNGTKFGTSGMIVAGNDINFNVNETNPVSKDVIFISSEAGDINLNGTDINLNAVLYAPHGTVRINANEFHLNGRIIADTVIINGTLIDIKAGISDFDILDDLGLFTYESFYIFDTKEDFTSKTTVRNRDDIKPHFDYMDVSETNIYKADNSDAGLILGDMWYGSNNGFNKNFTFGNIHVSESFSGQYGTITDYRGKLSLKVYSDKQNFENINIYNGHAYALSNNNLEWHDAERLCEMLGGHLVVIDDALENEFVRNIAYVEGKSVYTALGFTDEEVEGKWVWVNGSTSKYTNWNPGEPNDGGGRSSVQDHAYMYDDGKWDDGYPGSANKYMCEWEDVDDINIYNMDSFVIKMTVPAGAVISKEEDEDFKILEESEYEKVILYKAKFNKSNTIDIPIEISSETGDADLMKDISIFYNENGVIRSGKLEDISVARYKKAYSGYWYTVCDSGQNEALWNYIDLDALYPDDSKIDIYAYATDNLEDALVWKNNYQLKHVTREEMLSDNGVEGLKGRYLYIKAELGNSFDFSSPFLDKLIVGCNTEKRPERKEKQYIRNEIIGKDNICPNEEVVFTYKTVTSEANTGNVIWKNNDTEVKGVEKKGYKMQYLFDKKSSYTITAYYAEEEDQTAVKNVEVSGELKYINTEDLFSSIADYPFFNAKLDKSSYIDGDDVVITTDIKPEYDTIIYLDDVKNEEVFKDGIITLKGCDVGTHALKIEVKNASGNRFIRRLQFSVINPNDKVKIYFDKEEYVLGDEANLILEGEYVFNSCRLDGKDDVKITDKKITFNIDNPGVKIVDVSYSNGEKSESETFYLYINEKEVAVDNDHLAPSIDIISPKAGDKLDTSFDIIGTIKDDTALKSYKLSYKKDDGNYTYFASGDKTVENSVLGSLDVSNFEDGKYIIRIEAKDVAGNKAYKTLELEINKKEVDEESEEVLEYTLYADIKSAKINDKDEVIEVYGNIKASGYIDSYILSYKNENDESETEIVAGTSETSEVFDETGALIGAINLENVTEGKYYLNLYVLDIYGNSVNATASFVINKETKQIECVTEQPATENIGKDIKEENPYESSENETGTGENGEIGQDTKKEVKYEDFKLVLSYLRTSINKDVTATAILGKGMKQENLKLYKNDVLLSEKELVSHFTSDSSGKVIIKAVYTFDDEELADLYEKATSTDAYSDIKKEIVVEAECTFFNNKDKKAPFAAIVSPDFEKSITAPVEIKGTLCDETRLDFWRLEYRPINEDKYTVLAEGKNNVDNNTLGHLDPTKMMNGEYELRLYVQDQGGNISKVTTVFYVEGNLKIGKYHIGFTDLTSNIGGVNVNINRIYDSRNKNSSEFGYGWNMDLVGIKLIENHGIEDGYQMIRTGSNLSIAYKLSETLNHDIVVSYGDGTSDRFKLVINKDYSPLVPVLDVSFGYKCVTDQRVKLEILADTTAFYEGGQVSFLDESIYGIINYKLTTKDGDEIYLNKSEGVYKIVDSLGHTINVDDNGFHGEDGRSIEFNRDETGRIISICDFDGSLLKYDYDENGDLSQFTDIGGRIVSFEYDKDHNLISVKDPTRKTVARNEYDEDGRLIATIDADGNRTEYDHDVDGRQEVVSDRLGNKTVYIYDDNGNVLSTTDANGHTTKSTYDSFGNVLTYTDAKGNVTTSSYDENGNLTSVVDAAGNKIAISYNSKNKATKFTAIDNSNILIDYDDAGNILSTTDKAGNITSYEVDSDGNVKSISDSIGKLVSTEYDAKGNVISVTDRSGRRTDYTYDSKGNKLTESYVVGDETKTIKYNYNSSQEMISYEDSEGHLTTIERNDTGKMTASVDSEGRRTSYEYDLLGNLTCVLYSDGTKESFSYDAEGRLITSTDRLGLNRTFSYDKVGNLIKEVDARGNEINYTYDENNNLIKEEYPTGESYTYVYDILDRNTEIIDSDGGKTVFEYNELSLITAKTDAKGNTVKYEYNKNDERNKIVYPDGSYEQVETDSRGRCTLKRDIYGRTTKYTYDNGDRLLSVIQSDGAITSYEYDKEGNVISITDANENKTEYQYDTCNRRKATILADGSKEEYFYDSYGKLISVKDYNKNELSYLYDEEDRLTSVKTKDHETDLVYDSYGRIKELKYDDSKVSYDYNEFNELKSKSYETGEVVSYFYDLYGRKIKITVSKDGKETSSLYSYDKKNRLTRVLSHDGKATVYSYDENGNREKAVYSNGVTVTYTYDECNRLKIEKVTDHNERTLVEYSYEYKNGQRISSTENYDDGIISNNYEYDDRGRLIKEKISNTREGAKQSSIEYTYQYDKVSNRVSKSVNGIKTEYAYNNRNQLISEKTGEDTVTYDYDPNGNLINKNENGISTIYSYDDFNRMIRYTSSKEDYSYTYDAEGVRRSKTDTKTNNKTVFVSDTNAAYSYTLAEISDDGSYVTYLNVGEVLSKNTEGKDSFYIYDGQGNVRIILDESGNTVSSYQYNAYGELLDKSGDFSNRYLYCGEVCDEESGLYYLRARYMDPSTGTFTSMDSYEGRMSDPDSLHKYLYANANPIGYKDPSGHTSVAEQACATAIMAVVSQRYTICLAGLMGAIFGAAVSPLLKGNANAEDHMLKSMISGFIMGAGISAIGFIAAAVFSISLIHFYLTVALISTTTEFVEALYCMSQGKTKEYFVHLSLSLISFVGFSKLYNMPDAFPSMGKGKISKYANAVEDRGLGYRTNDGKSSEKIGDFTNLEGCTVDDILDRIPDDAVLRELRPVQGGATEGFEFKWTENGQTYRVRVHNSDPSAPVGTNAYNGWVVRIQRGKWYYDPTINDFREAKYFNPNGPFFDETIVNNTHIPIHNPYED